MPVFHTPQPRRSSMGRASLGLDTTQDENVPAQSLKPAASRNLTVRRSGPFGQAPASVQLAGSNVDAFFEDCVKKLKLPSRRFKFYTEAGEIIKDVSSVADGASIVLVMHGETFKRVSPDSKSNRPTRKPLTPLAASPARDGVSAHALEESLFAAAAGKPVKGDETLPLDGELHCSPGLHPANPITLDLSALSAISPVESAAAAADSLCSPVASPFAVQAVHGAIRSPGREQPQRLSFDDAALGESPARVFSPVPLAAAPPPAAAPAPAEPAGARPDDSLVAYQNVSFTLAPGDASDEKHLSPEGVRRHQRISIAAALLAGPRASALPASPASPSTASDPGPAHSPESSPRSARLEAPPSRLRAPQVFSPKPASPTPSTAAAAAAAAGDETAAEEALSLSMAAEASVAAPVLDEAEHEPSVLVEDADDEEEEEAGESSASSPAPTERSSLRREVEELRAGKRDSDATVKRLKEEKAATHARLLGELAAQARTAARLAEEKASLERAVAEKAAQAEAAQRLAAEKEALEKAAAILAAEKAALERAAAATAGTGRKRGFLSLLGRAALGAAGLALAAAFVAAESVPAALS
eukprot:tig00001331_g8173.t1